MNLEKDRSDVLKHAADQSVVIMAEWKKRARRFRMFQYVFLAVLLIGITAFLALFLYSTSRRIPSKIYMFARRTQQIDLRIPATGKVRAASGGQESNVPKGVVTVDLSGPVTMLTGQQDHYDMEVRLFGILPLKKVDIHVIEDQELIPAGIPVGIYMHCKGILVVGVAEFETIEGKTASPAKNLLKAGDYVRAVNGKPVEEKEELIRDIEDCNGKTITLTVMRDGRENEVVIKPVQNALGKYKAGIWVRDNVQGVGTLTFVDANGNFGALGHGIADVDTGNVMEVEDGTLYETEIISLRRGENGNPGEMTGRIIYNDQFALGEIYSNDDRGIYGRCNERILQYVTEEALPIGLKQEIEIGSATILCTIDQEVERFQVEITKVHLNHDNVNRGIELKVTDPGLIERTGGIVQGMSGSPILQNGKIIGAVTHVLVNSPEKGYGIFIENMLEARE